VVWWKSIAAAVPGEALRRRKMAAILVSAPLHRETKAIKETVDGTRPGPPLGPQWASW
jgi:hypothetical protein